MVGKKGLGSPLNGKCLGNNLSPKNLPAELPVPQPENGHSSNPASALARGV